MKLFNMEISLSFLEKNHQLDIDRSHYIRRLGYPKDYEVPEHIQKSMDWAAQWYQDNGNPWMQIYELDVVLEKEKIFLNTVETHAPKIYNRFYKYNVNKALLIVSTAGNLVDKKTAELWSSDEPDRSFFLDTFAASVTEALVSFGVDYINEWAAQKNRRSLSRYSPGYPGWDLKEQFLLMDIIKNIIDEEIPVTISDTALLTPLKSQLSLIGIYKGEVNDKSIAIECTTCNFMDCSCKDKGMFVRD